MIFKVHIILIFSLILASSLQRVCAQSDDDDEDNSEVKPASEPKKDEDSSDSVIEKKADPEDSDTSTNKVPTSKRKQSKKGRILKQIDTFRERAERGKDSLTTLIESFMGRGDEIDQQKLDEALEKYDEIVEDVEADFTKAKIEVGLRFEDGMKRYNQTASEFMEKFRVINEDFVDWSNANRARMLGRLRKRLLSFNDLLSMGVERLLEISERGKDTIRQLHKKRYQKRASIFDFLRV
ncbi:uncharacterized protein LOC141849692 [Brevipalpus obovatus]|uniref:uncharacterized protein LOC141849692 n=1 Tax=Brevipalpus obovatus TaxID=246614 RepID=UPI003D9F3CC5